jgi:hypothetical protein
MQSRAGTRLEETIGRIDRRYVYLGLLLFTLVPLVAGFGLPLYVTEPAKLFRKTIDDLPQDKLVFISSDWDAGSQAETRPQFITLIRHLVRRNLKFAIICIAYPTSVQMAQTAILEAIQLEGAQDRWIYGEHWVNLGYKAAEEPWLHSFTSDITDGVKEDIRGTPLAEIPVMKGVHRFGPDGQVSTMINISGSNTPERWFQFLGPTKVKILLGCTAVMAPEQYPYLDSGQLSGLLTGMKGAAEYEKLLSAPGTGTPMMGGQSFAHLYILLLILMGNLSLVFGWWERRRAR